MHFYCQAYADHWWFCQSRELSNKVRFDSKAYSCVHSRQTCYQHELLWSLRSASSLTQVSYIHPVSARFSSNKTRSTLWFIRPSTDHQCTRIPCANFLCFQQLRGIPADRGLLARGLKHATVKGTLLWPFTCYGGERCGPEKLCLVTQSNAEFRLLLLFTESDHIELSRLCAGLQLQLHVCPTPTA